MYKANTISKQIRNGCLDTIANNLFRYHSIKEDISNDLWRITTFEVGNKEVTTEFYKGKLQGITH